MLAVALGNIAPMGVSQDYREVQGPSDIPSVSFSRLELYHRLGDTCYGHTLVSLLHLKNPGLTIHVPRGQTEEQHRVKTEANGVAWAGKTVSNIMPFHSFACITLL